MYKGSRECRRDQENEEDGSHGAKKEQNLTSEILVQKGTNLIRNERQGNKVGNLFLPNLVLHPRRRKKRSKKQSKANRDEEQDSSIFFFIVFSFLEF